MPLVGSSSSKKRGAVGRGACQLETARVAVVELAGAPIAQLPQTGFGDEDARRRRAAGRPGPRRRRAAATSTFSRTVSDENRRRFWKVRTSPARAIVWVGAPVRSASSSDTVPSATGTSPVMTLTSVVLPAPFGPIRPRISRRRRALDRGAVERAETSERDRDPIGAQHGVGVGLHRCRRVGGVGAARTESARQPRIELPSSSRPFGRRIMKPSIAAPSTMSGRPSRKNQSAADPSSPRPKSS